MSASCFRDLLNFDLFTHFAATRLPFVSVRCECVNTYSADDLQSEYIVIVNIGEVVYGVVALTWFGG